MHVLQIEHPVPDFETWKRAFDGDPVGRERSGVRRYRVMRPIDDGRYAIIELEFDSLGEAEAMERSLRELWGRVEGRVMTDPKTRIVEIVESRELASAVRGGGLTGRSLLPQGESFDGRQARRS